ncbi:MAG: GNVR domain-containing protein, partial [Desulfobacteraceae bacterium]
AAAVAVALPPIYRSQAVIIIEAQQIPDEYVKSTITSYAEQRLSMITREILRFNELRAIIEEFGLYPKDVQKGDIGSAVSEMKKAVEIEPISSKVGVKSYTVAFNLSYEAKDPQKAFAVADRLSKLYLKKETETREKQAAATTGFLENELANLKQQIDSHEKKISEFKQLHINELPGSVAANLSTLQRLERELDQINGRIRSLQDRKIYLKGQLANIEPLKPIQTDSGKLAGNPQERLRTLRLNLIRARARLSDKHPDIRKMIGEIEELERQIGQTDTTVVKVKQLRNLRTELNSLQASKGNKHPDVINLRKQIDELAKEVDTLLSQKAMVDMSKEKPDNPAYINLMTQVVASDLEVKNLNEDILRINALIQDYRGRIERAPVVEQEFNELTLDYKNAKKRYDEISDKLLNSRVAQEMEIQQQGEHFTITDPAYVPSKPIKPNRMAIMMLGFVLAIGAGLGGAAFKEATDNTIKSSAELIKFEGVDLLTTMPYTPTSEESRHQLFKRLATVTWCLGILGIVLVAVDRLIYPLGDVLSIVFERLAN